MRTSLNAGLGLPPVTKSEGPAPKNDAFERHHFVTLVTRLNHGSPDIEVEWTVGPLKVGEEGSRAQGWNHSHLHSRLL
jgi:hypothetical protein